MLQIIVWIPWPHYLQIHWQHMNSYIKNPNAEVCNKRGNRFVSHFKDKYRIYQSTRTILSQEVP